MIGLTRLAKAGGPLTKRIFLDEKGKLVSDGSACVMSRGHAVRVRSSNLSEIAALIHELAPHEAIALGSLKADLLDQTEVITQDRLAKMNGSSRPDLISRTSSYIAYEPGQSALALIDVDTKGMPDEVKARIREHSGFWAALVSVVPELAGTARIERRSTTTGLSRSDTGETLPGSNGMHVFLHVQDGADIERFLKTLHERCWLAGLGWHMVGAGGQLLDRSLVDRMVFAAERLVFEGAPVLVAPLVQDQASRQPKVHPGIVLDTREACPPLRITEQSELKKLKAQSAHALAPHRAAERDRFVALQIDRLTERAGVNRAEARRIIERQCEGVLLPDVVLPWDDDQFAGCTVADVLADPARFVGATLADPLEGPDYGRTKAKIMRRADGSPWINSFAHGRTAYELRYDARAAAKAVQEAPDDQAADRFVELVINGDLTPDQEEALRNQVADVTQIGRRTLSTRLKEAKKARADADKRETRERQAAERTDPRPQIEVPAPDAPWIPQMTVLDDVLGTSPLSEPPMRDVEGAMTQVRVRRVPNMHALSSQGANDGDAESRLPAPELPLLTRLNDDQVAEVIERHIDYIDRNGRSVHLPPSFVRHYTTRLDDSLPIVSAVATLPIVMPDGVLLSERGLDRERGIVFRVPSELLALVPRPEECTPAAVVAAMRLLTEEWLCDVATDYVGKCILIAAALTVMERSVLPERPAFFVTAGRRGGGKTTVLIMLLVAATGIRPSAAAWSPNEEERRKSLLSYLIEALPAIIWDNIPRGAQIACPHIEKSCTTAFYSDRRLGVSEMVAVSASAVHLFTGNNIAPRGDLASRSLQVRLEVDRPDPENRPFRHADPVGWTEKNRGRILRALYTILLGNPALKPDSGLEPQTRFKTWWKVVAAAVENAARLHERDADERSLYEEDDTACSPTSVNFRDLFLKQEEDEEESASLSDALTALARKWPDAQRFRSADVAKMLNDRSEYRLDVDKEGAATLREFLFGDLDPGKDVSAIKVAKQIKKHVGEPVQTSVGILILREATSPGSGGKGALDYYVQAK